MQLRIGFAALTGAALCALGFAEGSDAQAAQADGGAGAGNHRRGHDHTGDRRSHRGGNRSCRTRRLRRLSDPPRHAGRPRHVDAGDRAGHPGCRSAGDRPRQPERCTRRFRRGDHHALGPRRGDGARHRDRRRDTGRRSGRRGSRRKDRQRCDRVLHRAGRAPRSRPRVRRGHGARRPIHQRDRGGRHRRRRSDRNDDGRAARSDRRSDRGRGRAGA